MRRNALAIGAAVIVTIPLHIIWSRWNKDAPVSSCPTPAAFSGTYSEKPRIESPLTGSHSLPSTARVPTLKSSSLPAMQQVTEAPIQIPREAYVPASEIMHSALSVISDIDRGNKAGPFSNPVVSWHKQAIEGTFDPNWSPMAQEQAASYLAETMSPDIEIVSVNCNSTVCEIQATSTSAQNSVKAANEWQTNIAAMTTEPWWTSDGFDTPNSAIWSSTDGRAILVSYLTRAAP